MEKVIIAIVGFLFSTVVFAGQEDCSVTLSKLKPYGGVVGTVTKVTEGPYPEFPDVVLIDFQYKFPNGFVGWTYTGFKSGTIKVGDKFFWLPANKEVRKSHPDEDYHAPIVMDSECRMRQIDLSGPAADIEGF